MSVAVVVRHMTHIYIYIVYIYIFVYLYMCIMCVYSCIICVCVYTKTMYKTTRCRTNIFILQKVSICTSLATGNRMYLRADN